METIKITKPRQRWLFGGVGFQNSEATMMPLMSEKFRNERVLKVFREISPTFSRCFIGYADWTKEAMDSFADYYDKTFRNAGTLIICYLVLLKINLIHYFNNCTAYSFKCNIGGIIEIFSVFIWRMPFYRWIQYQADSRYGG